MNKYRPNDCIPCGDLIKAYILHWLNFDPAKHTSESLSQWHAIQDLMTATLNQLSVPVPNLPGLEDVQIEA